MSMTDNPIKNVIFEGSNLVKGFQNKGKFSLFSLNFASNYFAKKYTNLENVNISRKKFTRNLRILHFRELFHRFCIFSLHLFSRKSLRNANKNVNIFSREFLFAQTLIQSQKQNGGSVKEFFGFLDKLQTVNVSRAPSFAIFPEQF